MIDFVEYVVSELKSRRLSRDNALTLIRQFSAGPAGAAGPAPLHPLLHRNASDIHQQCYRSTFDGSEFFLEDHQVAPAGRAPLRVLPGVAYLEMARAAVRDAIPEWSDARRIRLDDVVWIKPVAVEAPRDVFVALALVEPGHATGSGAQRVEFEIFTIGFDADGVAEETVHCRGLAAVDEHVADGGVAVETAALDLAALAKRMNRGSIDADAVYDGYARMGMRFGPGHRAVRRVLRGDGEALAQLALPAAVADTHDDYALHPSLMDGALQSAIGLLDDPKRPPEQPSLPFALASLHVHAPCPRDVLVWLRHAPGSAAGDKVSRLDIDLCDADGRVCVSLRGFASRALNVPVSVPAVSVPAISAAAAGDAPAEGLVLAAPVWTPRARVPATGDTGVRAHLLLCGLPTATVDALRAASPEAELHLLPAGSGSLERDYAQAALDAFAMLHRLLSDAARRHAWVQLVVADSADSAPMLGLSGLLKSAALEQPALRAQTVLVDAEIGGAALAARLRDERAGAPDALVRYAGDERSVRTWQALDDIDASPQRTAGDIAFKEDGVYLITGGLGGLGRLFANDILTRTPRAAVVLTGRAARSDGTDAALRALHAEAFAAGRLEYIALDLADADDVARTIADVWSRHRRLNGILHAAGLVVDALLTRKTAEDVANVLAPKVAGTVHLDAASAEFDLDFIALFSSGASILGNAGQADYAAANGFLDRFAAHRNRLAAAGLRRGRTVAVNWPLWAEGGMRMPQPQLDAMRADTGMRAMSTANGMAAFHRSLGCGHDQIVAIEGELEKVRAALFDAPSATPDAPVPQVRVAQPEATTAVGDLVERTRDYLRQQFSSLFKLPAHRIEPHAPLEKYGIDSVLAMDLTGQLEKSFGPLSKTLFFEHQTIDELTAYFIDAHAATLRALFPSQAAVTTAPRAPSPAPAPAAVRAMPSASERRRTRRGAAAAPQPTSAAAQAPIAIVGLSGRYPQSPDLQTFWNNLRDGVDCIVEIPASRWDWRDYYSEDRTVEGAHFSKWGGFIEGVDEFDPLFFGIPPVDADMIDPQERLFLQHAWMAIEDAGYTRAALQTAQDAQQTGQVGVYVGVMYGEYQLFGAEASQRGQRIGVPVSYASIANRVSYLFNVHGPSMTLDTMCSSSLAAIHLACQDLRLGRTHAAIAGGVNVSIHPNKYLILSAGQYISTDGHCQSFGVGGDGYIPGEGVGAVVLKRLSDAERDGNHIYGLIRGSALNHGGKTNGYSVPNPKAQAAVIGMALKDCGIDARHVGYIEAHGTGTRLGDPIEIAALNSAFRHYTQDRGFCAIGSAKSNIGHCESAAGIAGLTKVLLQMKHGMLVPSLHSQVLNPHIDFDASPFVVNQTLRPWERSTIDGRTLPRIAGISSFGAGGSNAHLVIEEYASAAAPRSVASTQALVPLSARTPDRLKQKARDLADHLRRADAEGRGVDLQALAYTLQIGREPMDARLACVVDSVAALRDALDAYVRGDDTGAHCVHGQVEKDQDGMSVLSQDEDMREAIDKWIARRKFAKLADLWVKGLALDWRTLHGDARLPLLSLPTYPFAKDRYWLRLPDGRGETRGRAAALHPLVHVNASDFHAQRYVSRFRGDEFFFADHRVEIEGARRKVLPGVAYLEMVRAAVGLAIGDAAQSLALRHIAWSQPVLDDGGAWVCIALIPADDDSVDFEVYSDRDGDGGDAARDDEDARVVHCQGRAQLTASPAETLRIDPAALRARMHRGTLAPEALYATFATMGLHYGANFRCVSALHRGAGEALAELALPEAADDGFALHPGLLDSALQSALGLVADDDALAGPPMVPFALDEIALLAPCAPRMFAWVRDAAGADGAGAGAQVRKLDIDLCDADGRVCVRLRGLASRSAGAREASGVLMARPEWEALPAVEAGVGGGGQSAADPGYGEHRVLLLGFSKIEPRALEAGLAGAAIERIAFDPGEASAIAARYRAAAMAVFERVQAILRQPPSRKLLLQIATEGEGADAVLAGLSGLIDTARLENPLLVGQLLLVASDTTADLLASQLRAARAHAGESLLRCADGALQTQRWRTESLTDAATHAYRDDGVYLITGGLGGLGLLFARDILRRTVAATVVLTGRNDAGDAQDAALAALRAECSVPAARLVYRRLDPNRADDTRGAIDGVVREFGALHGVLHSAGLARDGFIVKKSAGDFAAVLGPKVDGTAHLDAATQALDLDFLVLFSSIASARGNPGQADYAAANGFMDRYAEYRNALVAAAQRRGRTLSVHWPLWQEGGMGIDAETLAMMREASGMAPLGTDNGLRALHRALESGESRVLVVEGNLARLRRALQPQRKAATAVPQATATPAAAAIAVETSDHGDGALLLDRTQRYLREEFASLFRMSAQEVQIKAPLENYGMDSVLAMKLTNQLERSFGSLSKTLFFEYQTIAALAAYLVKAFPAALRQLTGLDAVPAVAAPAARVDSATAPSNAVGALPAPRLRFGAAASRTVAAAEDAVVIVGLGGRYPQAPDLDTFWRNLKAGRDSIVEIPDERWDHAPYFRPGRNQPGKTYSKWGGFLDGIDRFDALFFSISPKEAELMDPQERLFLETAWETIEDAGYGRDAIAQHRVGVYVGVMWGQYELYATSALDAGVPSSSFASIANRVSYTFDFHGPSLALDTMCSSSLTAIHLAAEHVRNGTVDAALAGGVNVSVHPSKYLSLSQGNFASTDGRCRSFGEGGDGYVPGEGVGAVLLKRRSDALRDGDRIYAVVKAGTINHGGKTNGYTVPNPIAQSDAILDALKKADIDPASIGYIETHGTGTSLGDPIEIAGLVRAYSAAARGEGAAPQSCAIGSVKSNIGHLEAAAGIAAVTKALLQLRYRQFVPSLHAERLNPNIDFAATPFRVQTALADWPAPQGHPRRVGVSSFGAGGANAHLILEEFVDARASPPAPRRPELFLLSARSRESLRTYAARMLAFLEGDDDVPLSDIAFTSQVGRTPMQARLAVVADSLPGLRERLRLWLDAGEDARGRRASPADTYEGSPRDAQSQAAALIDGDAGRAFLRFTFEQRDLAKLAQLWIAGVEIDWAPLHRDARPQRMSLPTYPFVRERYWIEAGAPFAASAPAAPATKRIACYRPVWRDAAPLAAVDAGIAGVVLLVGADRAMREAVASRSNGARVIAIDVGDAVRPLSGDDCAFDVSAQADLDAQVEALLDAASAEGQRIAAVLHAGGAGGGELAQRLDRGVHALHALCRAIARRKPKQTVRLLCAQRAAGDIAADAAHAALAGYLKSLALENLKFAWKTVSVDQAADADAFARIGADELCERAWRDGEVAYAGTQRRQRAIVAQALPAIAASALRQGGVYLITGGLGGLGALFAAHLAQRYAARLVLTGRSAADAATQARLDALRSQGGEAIYVRADVADAAQATAAVAAARTRFGRIDGVIHSAGIHRDAFALNKTRGDMAAVLAAKTLGTQHLDAALGDADLDFFALFSSVAGAFGNLGQCDYAYANAFMDAFAEARQARAAAGARKGRTLSLGWPLWSEGGMRIAESDRALTEQRTGMAPLPSADGIACWEALLHGDVAHALPLYGDAARIEAYLLRGVAAASAQTHRETPQALPAAAAASGAVPPAVDAADDGALRAAAEHYLKTLLGAQIKLPVERIDADERFESFGVDSMMIARINADLERDLGDLPKTLFYEYASVAELAAYLLEEARPALSRVVSMPAAPAPAPVVAAMPAIAPASQAMQRSEPRIAANEDVRLDRRIAIIGLHGRFPQSESLADYWRHLRDGRDLIGPVPPTRWDGEALYDADPAQAAHGRIYCKWGGFLQDVDAFDAAFFSISVEEAKILDPQERLFLQSVWSAVEDAGYTRDSLRTRHPKIHGAAGKAQGADVGVFVGVTSNTYQLLGPEAWHRGQPVTPSSMPWSIANRVSYVFDFQGPSLPIDTACSSSLVAIQMACDSLNRRECQLAVAGGVNLYLHPAKYHSLCSRGMLALEGQCRSFGTGDDGFIPGEGVGAVVLKPLAQAEADGDHIHGVVAGGAAGHAGRSNGYSAPNPNAQAQLIEAALDAAGVHPEQIGYVEGHGTGTQLGDNLEVVALTQAFRKRTRRTGFCPLGSVKANVGHSESAAGMAGVAKLLLQFAHRALPPTIHAGAPNADIDFAASPFYLQRDHAPWAAIDGAPRRAMINAFGAGGYNACLILEEYLPGPGAASRHDAETSRSGRQLIVLSARNAERLRASAAQLRDRLRESPQTDLARVAYTLQVGRETMEERFAVAATSVGALIAELDGYLDDAASSAALLGRVEAHQRRKSPKQDARDHARTLFARGELDALALLWVGGQDVVWEDMHPGWHPQRLSLPTYPFARDRHWVVEAGGHGAAVGARPADTVDAGVRDGHAPSLHPLLSHNASTLREMAFVTRLDADAYYARDHRVNGAALFPGAGFLEIACVAGSIAGEQSVLRIEDIVWMQPLRLEGDASLKTVLKPLPGGDGQGAEFQIVSHDADNGPMIHSEGRLRFGTRPRHVDGAQATFAIAELKARAQRIVSAADCYRSLQGAGFGYGPAFRTIQTLHSGSGFALAQLRLDDALQAEFDQYILHPSLIDGALQSVLGVVADSEAGVPYLPFSIGEIEILRPLAHSVYAYAEQVISGPTAQPDVRQFDIRLLAENGDVLVRINDFYVRAFRGAPALAAAAAG